MKYLFSLYLVFSIFFSASVLLFYQNSNYILFDASEKKVLSFSFQDDVTKDFVVTKVAQIKDKYLLQSAEIHSPTDQYEEFIKSFAMYNQGAFEANEILRLIPYTVDFNVAENKNSAEIKKQILAENLFQEAVTSTAWIDKLKSVANLVESLGRMLFLFMFIGTALMTAATIRILISQDEPQIKIRSYLGESFKAVGTRYFMQIGLLCSVALAVGFGLSYLAYQLFLLKIKSHFEISFLAERMHYLDLKSVLLILSGVLLAFMCGLFFSLKYLFGRIHDED